MVSDISNAAVLKVVRDSGEVSIREIGIKLDTWQLVSESMIYHSLSRLREAGLVRETSEGKYIATDLVDKVLSALDLSLTRLSVMTASSVVANPIFGNLDGKAKPDVFVAMPFMDRMDPIYHDHIKPTCDAIGLGCARADDFFEAKSIVTDIFDAIYKSQAVIADCTTKNPNVFYEIGISHTLGRPTILLSQTTDDIPFDLRHLRTIIYDYTPRGMETMEANLRKALETEISSHAA